MNGKKEQANARLVETDNFSQSDHFNDLAGRQPQSAEDFLPVFTRHQLSPLEIHGEARGEGRRRSSRSVERRKVRIKATMGRNWEDGRG